MLVSLRHPHEFTLGDSTLMTPSYYDRIADVPHENMNSKHTRMTCPYRCDSSKRKKAVRGKSFERGLNRPSERHHYLGISNR